MVGGWWYKVTTRDKVSKMTLPITKNTSTLYFLNKEVIRRKEEIKIKVSLSRVILNERLISLQIYSEEENGPQETGK